MKFKTKILTKEAAQAVYDNFRHFAGFYYRMKKLGENRYAVTSREWCWSHFVLYDTD